MSIWNPGIRAVPVLLAIAALAACATSVTSSVESFSRLAASDLSRTIAIMPNRETDVGSLRFQDIAGRLRPRLAAQGFKVVETADAAELLAILDFRVGGPRTEVNTYPTYDRHTEYDYINDIYVTVEVEGTNVTTSTVHDRALTLRIVDPGAGAADRGVLFEAYVESTGSCDRMSEVADEMFDALFRDFPHTTGEVSIPAQANC